MNIEELHKKTPEELNKELLDLRKEQFNLRMQRGVGQLARVHQFKVNRKNIARVKTILNEKEQTEKADFKKPGAEKSIEHKKKVAVKKTTTAKNKVAVKKTTTAKKKVAVKKTTTAKKKTSTEK